MPKPLNAITFRGNFIGDYQKLKGINGAVNISSRDNSEHTPTKICIEEVKKILANQPENIVSILEKLTTKGITCKKRSLVVSLSAKKNIFEFDRDHRKWKLKKHNQNENKEKGGELV